MPIEVLLPLAGVVLILSLSLLLRRHPRDCEALGHVWVRRFRRGYIEWHYRQHFRAVACEATMFRVECRFCGEWESAPVPALEDWKKERDVRDGWEIVKCSGINSLSGSPAMFDAMEDGGMYVTGRWSEPFNG